MNGVHFLLSDRCNQDPIEEFCSMQRAHGGRCDNPTAEQFLQNSISLRVQKSATLKPFRGNCSQKRSAEILVDDKPIPKRRRTKRL